MRASREIWIPWWTCSAKRMKSYRGFINIDLHKWFGQFHECNSVCGLVRIRVPPRGHFYSHVADRVLHSVSVHININRITYWEINDIRFESLSGFPLNLHRSFIYDTHSFTFWPFNNSSQFSMGFVLWILVPTTTTTITVSQTQQCHAAQSIPIEK